MSKQAIQFSELFKQLPLAEKISLLEMMLQEVKEQVLKKDNTDIKKRKAGFAKGTFVMSDDFNAPLEDFKDYM